VLTPLFLLVVLTAVQSQAVSPRDAPAPERATCAISGRITEQGSGRPLARATVRLVSASQRLEAIAGADGRYEFTRLEAGEYALWAGPGELTATHLAQAYTATAPLEFLQQPPPNLTLKAGEILSDVNFALARALAIEGRILDPSGEPMANIAVQVLHADGTSVQARSGESDDRGEFRVYGLPPGRYRVCAHPQSFWGKTSEDRLRFVRTCHLASISESSAADVMLDTEDATGVDIRVQRSATYSVSGSVLDATGAPADGVMIEAMRDDHSGGAHAISRSGQFVLNGLIPEHYAVWASIGGPENPRDKRPPAREREFGYGMVDIDSSDAAGIVLSLCRGVKISGRVRFEEGATAPSRLHIVVQTGLSEAGLDWIDLQPFSAVDDDLNFELAGVYRLPLIVSIRGLPDGWVLKSVTFDGRDITGVATDLGASPRRRLEIRLTNRVARPRTRVTDASGQPVTSYTVFLLPTDPARWKAAFWGTTGTPSRDGVLELGARLPGDYLVAAMRPSDGALLVRDQSRIEDLVSVSRRVTLAEGDDRLLELHLTRLPPARQ
jgi:carboxypeptidase family protein